MLTVLSGFANETPGNTIRIEINEPTDFSNFRPGQLIEVISSRRNDGEYIIARVSPNMIEIQFDPTGPAPLTSDAATALTEASVQAVVFSDLTTFQKGSQLFLNGSLANSGILRVSPFFDPTLNEIQVLDLLTSESAGQDLDVYQIGSTLLSGFNDGDTVLIFGSLANDRKYTEHIAVTLNFRAEHHFFRHGSCRFSSLDFERPDSDDCLMFESMHTRVTLPLQIRTTTEIPTWLKQMPK